MFENEIKGIQGVYEGLNNDLIGYYNKSYNYSKIVALMGSDFSKLLSTELIESIFKAKRALHTLEKKFTLKNIEIEFYNSKMYIYELRERKKIRAEAINAGIESESGIEAHIQFCLADYYCEYEEFTTYRNSINHLQDFFLKENRNLDQLLSQGKSLAYSGHKFNDKTGIFGYGDED